MVVNNIAVGSFLDVTSQVGTRASNPDFPGVVATITDIDVDANNITSSLTISSAGLLWFIIQQFCAPITMNKIKGI